MRWWAGAGLLLLYLVRIDLWWWSDGRLVLGLPIGLLYHAGFCLLLTAWFALLVRTAWPRALDEVDRADASGGPR